LYGNLLAINRLGDIWFLDVVRRISNRVTTNPFYEANPIWSPDGRFIVFNQNRLPPGNNLERLDLADYKVELLYSSSEKNMYPMDWSRDGRLLLYLTFGAEGGELSALPLDSHARKSGEPILLTQRGVRETGGQFSPDGKWIVYESDKSGQSEIYIRRFPGPGSEVIVSNKGGNNVRWRRDGKELFYIAPDGQSMAVPLEFSTQVSPGLPVPLFQTRLHTSVTNYVVSPDGQKFLMYVSQPADSPIKMILNWKAKP
jgi:Tol biopolymer transport system component